MNGLVIQSAARTDVGCRRSLNEDAFLVRDEAGLWVVCDGVGGHDAGDAASRAAVAALAALPDAASAGARVVSVRRALADVHDALRRMAGPNRTIATTVVALLARDGYFACLWAGDSRAYRLRDGVLQRISRDHSLVQELVDAGALAESQAENHPQANVITRAVGVDDELVLDKVLDRIEPGDVFLLCSDGLTKVVDDRRIAGLMDGATPQAAVDALIGAALDGGGPDNVTVVIVAFKGGRR